MKYAIVAYMLFAAVIAGYAAALALRHKAVQRRIASFKQ